MRSRIFFIHTGSESFTKLDLDLLSGSFDVQDFYVPRKFPAEYVRYWQGVSHTDLVFGWFAGWNSLWALAFAKLFHKPSILVIGGYDLASLPEAKYGHQRGGAGKWISRLAMKLATELITNSYFSQKEAERNAGISPQRVRVIYHGVPDPFGTLPQNPKELMALTVGKVEWSNLKRKGIEPFVQTASYLPDVRFVVVGAWEDDSVDYLRGIAPPNVFLAGRVSDEELLSYYRRASVYVQASLHEGFGMSVAEAMLAGCIPVVTRAGALPEVVGDGGIYIESVDPAEISRAIREASSFSQNQRQLTRNRILNQFTLEKRRLGFEQIFHSIDEGLYARI